MVDNKTLEKYVEHQVQRTAEEVVQPIADLCDKLETGKDNAKKRRPAGLHGRTKQDPRSDSR